MNQKLEDKYIDVAGIKTRYWQAGNAGKTVILVHGFAASVEYWMYNIDELSKYFRVYALDLVGFGRTDKPKVKYTAEFLADFIKDFLQIMQLDKVNLIGHSLGGAVCLQFAINYPELLEKLVLVDSAGFGQQIPHGLRLLSLPILGKFLLRFNQRRFYAQALRAYAYQKHQISNEFIDKMFTIFQLPETKASILRMLRQHANYFGIKRKSIDSISNSLNKINTPTLIIWGRQDRMLLLKDGYTAMHNLSNATMRIFEQCGHIPQMEKRDQFNELLIKYLRA